MLTNVLWFRAIHAVGPWRASLFANLQFFLAAVFAVLLLSESISTVQIVGGLAIAAGILLAPRERVAVWGWAVTSLRARLAHTPPATASRSAGSSPSTSGLW